MMKNTNLIKPGVIDINNIDFHHYTVSLLNEAYRVNIYTLSDVQSVHSQIMDIFKQYVFKFTHGESSNVTEETGQNIMQSILYTLDAYLMNLNNLEHSSEFLRENKLKEIHNRGLSLLADYVNEAQALYEDIQENKLEVDLEAYNASIDYTIKDFFKDYDFKFDGHSTPASIDYPLYDDDMSITGILYIKQYLQIMKLENDFCRYFPKESIERILLGYGKIYQSDYKEMLINIFEIVMQNAIALIMLRKNPIDLLLTKQECQLLSHKLQGISERCCQELIEHAINILINDLQISDDNLRNHMRKAVNIFTPALLKAIQQHKLGNLLVTEDGLDAAQEISFESQEKMPDEVFRAVASELLLCRDGEAKAQLIQAEVHSLDDLIDILGADCIFGNEYYEIFQVLNEVELAIILSRTMKLVSVKDIKDSFEEDMHISVNELEWINKFILYLKALDNKRYLLIEKLAKSL